MHRAGRGTGGTETSQYPEEEEATARPGVVVSETGFCPNRRRAKAAAVAASGLGAMPGGAAAPRPGRTAEPNALGRAAGGGDSPVGGRWAAGWAWARVPRGTGNPAGSRGDHPPRRPTLGDR